MKKIYTLLFLSIFTLSFSQTFSEFPTNIPNLSNSVTVFGDVDNDGDLDLYISGLNVNNTLSGGLYIYENGTYTLSTTSNLPLVSLGSAKFSDTNNDGNLDILISGYDANYVGTTDVYQNNADGTFTALNLGLPSMSIVEVAFADFSNDGNIDIALTGTETDTYGDITKLFHNNGDNTFTEITNVTLPGMSFGRIKFADYNNDNQIDFLLSGYGGTNNTYFTKIYTNDGNESFSESTIELEQLWLGDTAWGDYDNDGFIDIAISGTGGAEGADKMTKIYHNNGDNTFTLNDAQLIGVTNSALEWADFDGDNDLDLLVTGEYDIDGSSTTGKIFAVYNNDGTGAFTASTTVDNVVSSHYGDVDTGDFDQDGKIDIVVSGFDENDQPATNVYRNTSTLAVNNYSLFDTNIYPIPSHDNQLTIENNNHNKILISIFSISGQKVFDKTIFNTEVLKLNGLSKGIYLMRLNKNNQILNKKIVLD